MSAVTERRGLQCEASPACREPVSHVATNRHTPPAHVCTEHARRLFAQGWRLRNLEEEERQP